MPVELHQEPLIQPGRYNETLMIDNRVEIDVPPTLLQTNFPRDFVLSRSAPNARIEKSNRDLERVWKETKGKKGTSASSSSRCVELGIQHCCWESKRYRNCLALAMSSIQPSVLAARQGRLQSAGRSVTAIQSASSASKHNIMRSETGLEWSAGYGRTVKNQAFPFAFGAFQK